MYNDDQINTVPRKQVAVIGASDASALEMSYAQEVGHLLAQNGASLLSGGMGGIMEASCKSAYQSGGITIGIVPGEKGNSYLSVLIKTRMDQARNVILVGSSDGVIAIGGGYGTLSEISYALKRKIPVYGLSTWNIPGIISCNSPKEAVMLAIKNDAGNLK
ncbi:MAG: TIGR00725 family protein [Methanomicrobiales archaeon]|nr:TIGR00725 family protein [Methanomicrobiales archaeon]